MENACEVRDRPVTQLPRSHAQVIDPIDTRRSAFVTYVYDL
jgi:hypothetical protein